ncbi:MAG TPA: S4 domain-containing protein, partial [Candidatus Sulfotelmatobacter sp.]|nr:S4 domain-containing protein [Candidatus Sulfotelmatobacter sp.]
MTHDFVASPDDSNQRLDRVVAAHCPDLSRTRVQELIDSANILVNGKPAKVSHRLRGGERISVTAEPRPPMQAEPESIPLEILYEDDDVLA